MLSDIILAISTSSRRGSVALGRDGSVLAAADCDSHRDYSRKLLPLIDTVIRQAGLEPAVITRIGVDVGPGSFTGIRIGIAAAKALAVSMNIPVLGFSSLAIIKAVSADSIPVIQCGKDQYFIMRGPAIDTVAFAVLNGGEVLAGTCWDNSPVVGRITVCYPDARVLCRLCVDASAEALPPTPLYLKKTYAD